MSWLSSQVRTLDLLAVVFLSSFVFLASSPRSSETKLLGHVVMKTLCGKLYEGCCGVPVP